MGNCYSKNSNKVRAGTPAKGWTQMQKQEEEFNKNGKIDTEYVLPEKRPLKESDNSFEETSEFEKLGTVTKKTLRSSSADCVPEHFNPVTAGCSAVHSDNGTENTSNIQESLRESQLERDELAKKLERLSRGSCHKCGNFKLDDFTLSALLADTYCLCGPKQLGRPTVNPRCQTHGSERIHRRDASTTSYTNCDPVAENGSVGSRYVKLNVSDKDVDDSLPKSDSKKLNSANKDQSIRKNVRESNVSLSSSEKSRNFGANTFDEDINRNKAPLAQFDSMEANLNDFSIDMNQKRRSLLSEILDITESVCKCNFYSNEHCTNNNGAVDTVRGRCNDISEVCIQGQSHETGKCSSYVTGYPVESSTSRNAENICGFSSDSPQRLSSPNNKSSSLPKNVSFAACEDISHEASVNSSPAKLLPKLGGMNLSHLESVTSESSLGAYTQKTSSDLFLAKRQKGNVNNAILMCFSRV